MEENLYVFDIEQDIFENNYPWELHIAASKGDLKAVQEAYTKGFSANTFFEGCCSYMKYLGKLTFFLPHAAIHCAAYNGNVAIMNYFISKGVNINQPAGNEATPLHYSLYTENPKLEMVKLLVENGANTKAFDSMKKWQPLHPSANLGIPISILKFLIVM